MHDLLKIIAVSGVRAGAALLAFLTAMLATRIFAPADFGKLSLLWSTATVVAVGLDLGATIAFRKLGHDASRAGERIGRSLTAYATKAALLLLALTIGLLAFPGNADLSIFIFVVPLSLAFAIEAFLAEIFRVRQMYFLAEAFSGGARQAIYLIALAVGAAIAVELGTFVAFFSLTCVLLAVLLISIVGKPRYAFHRSYVVGWTSKSEGAEQLRFFSTQALVLLGLQFPLLAAGLFASDQIAASVRISLLFGMLMQFAVAANSLYFAPKLARIEPGDEDTLFLLVRRSSMLGLIFLPAGIILAALMPQLIGRMFGEAYISAVPGAQVITLTHAVLGCFGAYAQMLLMRGWDRINLRGAMVTLAVEAALLLPLQTVAPENCYVFVYACGLACSGAYLACAGRRHTGLWPGGVWAGRLSGS